MKTRIINLNFYLYLDFKTEAIEEGGKLSPTARKRHPIFHFYNIFKYQTSDGNPNSVSNKVCNAMSEALGNPPALDKGLAVTLHKVLFECII